jgi:hypothetical protein
LLSITTLFDPAATRASNRSWRGALQVLLLPPLISVVSVVVLRALITTEAVALAGSTTIAFGVAHPPVRGEIFLRCARLAGAPPGRSRSMKVAQCGPVR